MRLQKKNGRKTLPTHPRFLGHGPFVFFWRDLQLCQKCSLLFLAILRRNWLAKVEDLWSGTPNSQARFNFHSIPNPNPNPNPQTQPTPTRSPVASCQWPGYLQNLGRGDLERCPMDFWICELVAG